MTQALAVNIFEQANQLTIRDRGDLWLRIRTEGDIQVGTGPRSGLKWNGMLYPFEAFFARQGDTWIIRADTLQFKAPVKAKTELLPIIILHVNAFLAAQGDLNARIEEWRLTRQFEQYQKNMRSYVGQLEYAQTRLDQQKQDLQKCQQKFEQFLNEHPQFRDVLEQEATA